MSQEVRQIRIQQKVDTKSNWEQNNPKLENKEIGYERETGKYKIGDGEHNWNDLNYPEFSIETDLSIQNDEAEYSIVANDIKTNQAISTNSSAFGYNNIAGTKAFTITALNSNGDGTGTFTLDSTEGIEIGMRYTVSCYKYFENQGEIININGNVVTVNNYPDTDETKLSTGADDFINHNYYNKFIIVDHPELGTVNIGTNTVVLGSGNIGQQANVFIAGKENKTSGKHAAIVGTKNKAGYAAFVAGKENTALGEHSIAIGQLNNTSIEAWSSLVSGAFNTITAKYGFATNQNNKVNGKAASAFGENTEANAEASVTMGVGTVADGIRQLVTGRYNIRDNESKYIHIAGNGTNTNRKNAYTLDWQGNATFAGDVITKKGVLASEQDILGRITDKEVRTYNSNSFLIPASDYVGIKSFKVTPVLDSTREPININASLSCSVNETIKAADGNYYLKVTERTNKIAHRFNYVTKGLSREVGIYYISAWVKTVSGTERAQIFTSHGGAYGNTVIENRVGDGWTVINDKEWTKVFLEVDISQSYNSANTATGMHLGIRTAGLSDICIDNYEIFSVNDSTTNILKSSYDGSFENGVVSGGIGENTTTVQGIGTICEGGTKDYIPSPVSIPISLSQLNNGVLTLNDEQINQIPYYNNYTMKFEFSGSVGYEDDITSDISVEEMNVEYYTNKTSLDWFSLGSVSSKNSVVGKYANGVNYELKIPCELNDIIDCSDFKCVIKKGSNINLYGGSESAANFKIYQKHNNNETNDLTQFSASTLQVTDKKVSYEFNEDTLVPLDFRAIKNCFSVAIDDDGKTLKSSYSGPTFFLEYVTGGTDSSVGYDMTIELFGRK